MPPACTSPCRWRRSRRCRRATARWSPIDPEGERADLRALSPRSVLAFGTERHGLSAGLLERADARLAIPMREGVSSLNLATAVAAVLFARRL